MDTQIAKPGEKPANGAAQIAEVMAKILQPAASGDHEMLKMVAEYSIELSPQQQWALTMVTLYADDEDFTPGVRAQFKTVRDYFLKYKRFHDARPYVLRAVDSFTGYRLLQPQNVNASVSKATH